MSLFSPQNRDYTDPDDPRAAGPRDAPPVADHSSEALRPPPAGTEVVMSWFSVPENQFGGHGQFRTTIQFRR